MLCHCPTGPPEEREHTFEITAGKARIEQVQMSGSDGQVTHARTVHGRRECLTERTGPVDGQPVLHAAALTRDDQGGRMTRLDVQCNRNGVTS